MKNTTLCSIRLYDVYFHILGYKKIYTHYMMIAGNRCINYFFSYTHNINGIQQIFN